MQTSGQRIFLDENIEDPGELAEVAHRFTFDQLGRSTGRNHYFEPCAACGKVVKAWKGTRYLGTDGEYRTVHACCDAFMEILKAAP